MAGAGWKGAGVVLLVLGGIVFLLGIGGAIFGGLVANDALGDAGQCTNEACGDTIEPRIEGGVRIAIVGGAVTGFGILLLLLGTIAVVIGLVSAKNAGAKGS